MDLRQLEFVLAVAEERHFGRAAEQLRVSQPTVGQQIARLERELGVELFDRSGRTVRLTDAGKKLLPEATATLAAADRARATVIEPAGAAVSSLRIGTSTGMGARLDRMLRALRAAAPGI